MGTYDFSEGLPMQPGEASWASLKCGGGPHAEDQPGYQEPAFAFEQTEPETRIILPYAGTEHVSHIPEVTIVTNAFRRDLPA